MAFLGNHRPSGVAHIHWDTDGISSTYYLSESGDGIEMDVIYASKPDLVLTMCPEMREVIKQKGFPCEMMYYAFSPVFHHPTADIEAKDGLINLIGSSYSSLYPFRPEHFRYTSLKILLKPLLENGYPVHLYGDDQYPSLIKRILGVELPPENYHGYLPYERTCAVYNSSFLNIVTQNHERTITKRTFEILGSGGFVLSSDNSEIRKLFTPGRDLVVSSSPEQTLELAKYYEKNKDEWRAVRKNAALSVQNHTYKQRAEYILEQYNILTA
jgi:spore maturation protein CgeB